MNWAFTGALTFLVSVMSSWYSQYDELLSLWSTNCRDGVSESQFNEVLNVELNQIIKVLLYTILLENSLVF